MRRRPGQADVDLAYESAAKAFESWRSTTPAQRQEALIRIADAIEARAEMPYGGFKHSGYAKDLSMYGLEDYTRIKHVMANIES